MGDAQRPRASAGASLLLPSCRGSSPPDPHSPAEVAERSRRAWRAATGSAVTHTSKRSAVWPHTLKIGDMLTTTARASKPGRV